MYMLAKLQLEINYIWAELVRCLTLIKRYFLNFIADIPLIVIFMGVIFLGARSVNISKIDASIKVVNFVVYFVGLFGLQQLVNMIKEENELGTMEQLFLLPAGFLKIFFTRSVVNLIQQLALYTGVAAIFILLTGTQLQIPWLTVCLMNCLIWLGLSGIGLILGGITLIFKRISQVVSLITLLLFPISLVNFTGQIPLKVVAQSVPYTLGLELIQTALYKSLNIFELLHLPYFNRFFIMSIAYFVVGYLVFKFCLSKAKQIGTLGKY